MISNGVFKVMDFFTSREQTCTFTKEEIQGLCEKMERIKTVMLKSNNSTLLMQITNVVMKLQSHAPQNSFSDSDMIYISNEFELIIETIKSIEIGTDTSIQFKKMQAAICNGNVIPLAFYAATNKNIN